MIGSVCSLYTFSLFVTVSSLSSALLTNTPSPTDLIIKRCVGRITCDTCGKIENEYFSDFKEGDACGEGVFVKRADDNEETVTNRLKVYSEQTEPIIKFYEEKGILHRIVGGEDGPQRLTDEIISIIKN